MLLIEKGKPPREYCRECRKFHPAYRCDRAIEKMSPAEAKRAIKRAVDEGDPSFVKAFPELRRAL